MTEKHSGEIDLPRKGKYSVIQSNPKVKTPLLWNFWKIDRQSWKESRRGFKINPLLLYLLLISMQNWLLSFSKMQLFWSYLVLRTLATKFLSQK